MGNDSYNLKDTEVQELAEFALQVKKSSELLSCREAAKELGQRPNKFCKWLYNNMYTFKVAGKNIPAEHAIQHKWLVLKKVKGNDGEFHTQTFVTGNGMLHFFSKLKNTKL